MSRSPSPSQLCENRYGPSVSVVMVADSSDFGRRFQTSDLGGRVMREVPEGIVERLDGAASVFADRGFDQTRIEDLAEATGIPRATLYYYFAGKEDILAWLLRRMLAEMAEAVATARAGRARRGSAWRPWSGRRST